MGLQNQSLDPGHGMLLQPQCAFCFLSAQACLTTTSFQGVLIIR